MKFTGQHRLQAVFAISQSGVGLVNQIFPQDNYFKITQRYIRLQLSKLISHLLLLNTNSTYCLVFYFFAPRFRNCLNEWK